MRESSIFAIRKELEMIKQFHAWEVIALESIPQNEKIIGSLWVFVIKADGTYKARLCIKGCQQLEGLHYGDTFTAASGIETFRLAINIAAELKLTLTNGMLLRLSFMLILNMPFQHIL